MPVAMLSTVVSGCIFRHAPHVVTEIGSTSSSMPLPTNGPTAGLPVNCRHSVRVSRSYMSLLLW